MKKILGTVALLVALVIVWAGVWTLVTIPPAPDPAALPSQLLAPPPPDFGEAVAAGRTAARELTAEEKLPALSLAVAVDGEIVWAEAFGWADLDSQAPATPATLFRIGGISQSFTAAAVGLLTERGRIDLDAPVRDLVPEFPEKEWPLSLRCLMSHTAGLVPHRAEGGLFVGGGCGSDADRLALFADRPLRSRPGTEYAYSTWGWLLTGAAVAAAAGEPYEKFLLREVFAPLGMASTVPERAGRPDPAAAHFYYPRLVLDPRYGLHDSAELDLSCYLAAVGYLSTPSDLARFGSAMMSDRLLEPETILELQRPVRLESGEATGSALGWSVRDRAMGVEGIPVRIVGQGFGPVVDRMPLGVQTVGGTVAGSTATLLTVPERRIAVAVASNVSGAENVPLLAERLAEIFSRAR